jgi:hypothetical protein
MMAFDYYKQIQPYISDEVFFDIEKQVLKYNRLKIGVETRVTKKAKIDLYFINEADLYKRLHFNYIAGATFCMKL